ncbi:MAG: DUF1573 domain-containing protein [Bacteroidota bacterium]
MRRYVLLSLGVIFFLTNCTEKEEERKIEAVEVSENASIIRSPVSMNKAVDTVNVAKMAFKTLEYNFGTVNEGVKVKHEFKFVNTGKVPLLITEARSTCGCTVSKYPEDPIEPGASDVIKVEFNTTGKINNQAKPIIITANTYPSVTELRVFGTVVPK